MTGSHMHMLALHIQMYADREYMHMHTVYASQILYVRAEQRVGEATASLTHTHTHRYPTCIFTGGGM